MYDTPVVLYIGGDAGSVEQAWTASNDALDLEPLDTTAIQDYTGAGAETKSNGNGTTDPDGVGGDEDSGDGGDTVTAVADVLAGGRVDAVVCHGDGTFDVRAVVERVRDHSPSLPVVVFDVAGSFSAAAAAELDVTQYLQVDGDADPVDHLDRIASLVERHRAEQRERTMLASLLEHVPLSVYFKDREGRHVRVSDAMPLLTGEYIEAPDGKRHHTPEDVHGKTDFDLYQNEFAEQTAEDDRGVVEDGESIEDLVEHSQGDELTGTYVATSKAPWYDESGRIVGLVGVTRDISERKQYEKQLEHQNDRLERFTSVISHDLRNPLEVAMGRLEFAMEDVASERQAEHLDSVDRSLDRIDALIDDVLTLAREGEAVSDPERVTLTDLARGAWEVVDTGDATLDVRTDAELLAEPGRLQQLFENLFRNAVEHGSTSPGSQARQDAAGTSSGEPSVADAPEDAVEHGGESVAVVVGDLSDGAGFFVADDGPGIEPEKRDRVFEHGYTTGDDGTGLGLSIVRSIAEAHGWDLAVTESEAGGARFEVELFGTADDR